MRDVYITGAGAYLPGPPVDNDGIAGRIGVLDDKSERLGRFVLRQNRITTRHYALDEHGRATHANAEMAAHAARAALADAGLALDDMDMLATATSMGDFLVPGHASAVHGELGGRSIEIASFQSVCASATMAARAAMLNIQTGAHDAAVAVGSELPSHRFRPSYYAPAMSKLEDREARMSVEFLRWTLSDGAGAIVLEPEPRGPLSLRVDAILVKSLAHSFETCMYAGSPAGRPADLASNWCAFPGGLEEAASEGATMLVQDMRLLKRIFPAWVEEIAGCAHAGLFDPDTLSWMLCHYSAHSLRDEIMGMMAEAGVPVAEEKWFSNLSTRGNTGAAAIFLLLSDFLKSGRVAKNDTIFCIIPESGRALISFMALTAV